MFTHAKTEAIQIYAALREAERTAGLPFLTPWPALLDPGMRAPRLLPPYIINPSPVETLSPAHPWESALFHDMLEASYLLPHMDLTGFVWKYPGNLVTKALHETPEGKWAVFEVDKKYGVQLIVQFGGGSFHKQGHNLVTLDGNRPIFSMQRDYIHEMTHIWFEKMGITADPLKDDLRVFVAKKLWEEAVSEGNGMRHYLRSNPSRTPTYIEEEYVKAYKRGVALKEEEYVKAYKQEVTSNATSNAEGPTKPTPQQLHDAGLREGTLRLVQAFKDKEMVPSTNSKDSKDGYEEFYEKQWYEARKFQQPCGDQLLHLLQCVASLITLQTNKARRPLA